MKEKNRNRMIGIVALIIAAIIIAAVVRSCSGQKDNTNGIKRIEPQKQNEGKPDGKQTESFELDGISNIYAGPGCTFALTDKGELWGWGRNGGRLGNGSVSDYLVPVKIIDDVESISMSGSHVLAVRKDGTLWAWGGNKSGQLGDMTTKDAFVPKQVMEGIALATAGEQFSLALKKDGSLWAWGTNKYGQLGKKTVEDSQTPVKILGGVKKIYTGGAHVLAVMEDGSLMGWGSNQYQQLAGHTDSEIKSSTGSVGVEIQAEPVKLMDGVIEAAAGGGHSMALDKDGNVWAWGSDSSGELGDNWNGEWVSGQFGGRYMNTAKPAIIIKDAAQIAANSSNSAAVKKDGTLWVWGDNSSGQIGDGTMIASPVPLQITDEIEKLSLGKSHVMALKKDGTVWSWGSDLYGEQGDGYASIVKKPVRVMDDIKQVSSYDSHSLAVKSDGTLYAFGSNNLGQLGDGTWESTSVPKEIMKNILQAAAGLNHSLSLSKDGKLWVWGSNTLGQLGNGGEEDVHSNFSMWEGGHPVFADSAGKREDRVAPMSYKPSVIMEDVLQIGAAWSTSFAIRKDSSLWAWGYNELGHMGNNSKKSAATPQKTLDGIKSVIPLTFGIGTDGSLWSWGYNSAQNAYGKPEKILENVVSAAGADMFNIAVKSDGTLWVWGQVYSKLVENGSVEAVEPVKVGEDILSVAANYKNVFLVTKEGELWALESNSIKVDGQEAVQTSFLKYAKATKIMVNVKDVALGNDHVLVLLKDDSLWGYGNNNSGQLGDGKRFFKPRKIDYLKGQ